MQLLIPLEHTGTSLLVEHVPSTPSYQNKKYPLDSCQSIPNFTVRSSLVLQSNTRLSSSTDALRRFAFIAIHVHSVFVLLARHRYLLCHRWSVRFYPLYVLFTCSLLVYWSFIQLAFLIAQQSCQWFCDTNWIHIHFSFINH